jgi:hypothetical protein
MGLIYEETRGQKSRVAVPLNVACFFETYIYLFQSKKSVPSSMNGSTFLPFWLENYEC